MNEEQRKQRDGRVADLAAWLTQIWDEDERIARAVPELYRAWEASPDGPTGTWIDCVSSSRTQSPGLLDPDDAAHIARHDPASMLARIAADRQILARYVELVEWRDGLDPAAAGGARIAVEHVETVVRMLAMPYADRPGYREEWKS